MNNMNNVQIADINPSDIESNSTYIPRRNVQVEPGAQEMALFNSVEPGTAGSHKLESTNSYSHPGQHNPNVFGTGQQASINNDNFSGYSKDRVDPNEAKNLMGKINQIEDGSGLQNLNETEFRTVSNVIAQFEKTIALMKEDELDLWVPDNAPQLKEQLTKIGNKLIPFLEKYTNSIRKLG